MTPTAPATTRRAPWARVALHPMTALLLVGAVLSALLADSPAGVALGLAATLAGHLGGQLALQGGMLAGAFAFGVAVRSIVIGIGPRLLDRSTPRRTFAVRAIPLFLSVSIAPGRTPARPRMWSAALCSAIAGALATTAFAFTAPIPAVACGLTVAWTLLPRRTPNSTSTGWLLLHLLHLTGDHAARLDAAPTVTATVDATLHGNLPRAEELATHLATTHPTLRTARAARILVHQAHARYTDALALAMTVLNEPNQSPADLAPFMASLAHLACTAVEAGQLDPTIGLPIATNSLDTAEQLGYPTHKLTGTKALHALLTGNPTTAITLATHALNSTDDPLTRADDAATLARAYMSTQDNQKARKALSEAEKTTPWWPRVATTSARLTI